MATAAIEGLTAFKQDQGSQCKVEKCWYNRQTQRKAEGTMPFSPRNSSSTAAAAVNTPVKDDDAQYPDDEHPTPSRTPSRNLSTKLSKLRIGSIGSKPTPTPPRMRRGGPSAVLSKVRSSIPAVAAGGGSDAKTPTRQQEKLTRQAQAAVAQAAAAAAQPQSPVSIVPEGATEGGAGSSSAGGKKKNGPAHSGDTLAEYVLPENLRMDLSDDPSAGNNTGMEVIKVSKNGKQQARRLGIAPNNHAIYITTNKLHPQGLMFGLLKQGGEHDAVGSAGAGIKEVDLSRVVRMQLGQQSRRFAKAR